MIFSLDNEVELEQTFQDLKSNSYNLDLTRGKPSLEQLDLSNGLFSINPAEFSNSVDIRNYGELLGLEVCREFGSKILKFPKENVIAGGNSSLMLMSQYLASLYLHGSGNGPWLSSERISFLCPVPGYDRHFKLCEEFGINMIPIPLTGSGPNIDIAKGLMNEDPSIKGIWCVPKHSNPTGEIYNEECINGLLELANIRKNDFKILWDNAYAVHDFDPSEDLADIFMLSKESKAEDSIIAFTSTSKITFAGAGISFIAMSKNNLDLFCKHYSSTVIGPDKVNQARHVLFLKNYENLLNHMKGHAEILKPKFEMVEKWLSHLNNCSWTKPKGGYFVSFNSAPGLAKKIIKLSEEAGLKLTPAGSTFPYGVDPKDENIRLAPTACTLEELEKAMEIFVVCVSLANLASKV